LSDNDQCMTVQKLYHHDAITATACASRNKNNTDIESRIIECKNRQFALHIPNTHTYLATSTKHCNMTLSRHACRGEKNNTVG